VTKAPPEIGRRSNGATEDVTSPDEESLVDLGFSTREDFEVLGDDFAGRVSHIERHPPRTPVSHHGTDVLQMGEGRFDVGGITDIKCHSWHEDPVKEPLEHGGKSKAPSGKAKNQRLCVEQAVHVVLNGDLIGGYLVIAQALLSAQNGVEVFCVKVAVVNLMPSQA